MFLLISLCIFYVFSIVFLRKYTWQTERQCLCFSMSFVWRSVGEFMMFFIYQLSLIPSHDI